MTRVRWMFNRFKGLCTFLVCEKITAFAVVAITDKFEAFTTITSPQIIPSHHTGTKKKLVARLAPNIEIASMDFTVRNITKTRLSANWDLLIRVPSNLTDDYICPQGKIQTSLFYKNIALVTSSAQRYNLEYGAAQQIRVSVEEDIGGLVGINVIKDIKDKKEVKFGSHLFITDYRLRTTGVMSYACDETMLRFELGSETTATKFGNNPTCFNF
ncbi:PREDICTED: uncharacterized protein LOC104789753 [Camelina sativa]|uniref:Uncharacterized protein LOC104789753 n=1 Tax=Camelina sativa TaxID=90675 RepID=A0ABM1RPN5_CAMSA|nr:PREDICTED: uncharacterized protein LOC104789753 [Camelina sativa]